MIYFTGYNPILNTMVFFETDCVYSRNLRVQLYKAIAEKGFIECSYWATHPLTNTLIGIGGKYHPNLPKDKESVKEIPHPVIDPYYIAEESDLGYDQ